MEGSDKGVNEPATLCEGAQMTPLKWHRWMKVEHRAFSMLAYVGSCVKLNTSAAG
jgi:hypothetical protein